MLYLNLLNHRDKTTRGCANKLLYQKEEYSVILTLSLKPQLWLTAVALLGHWPQVLAYKTAVNPHRLLQKKRKKTAPQSPLLPKTPEKMSKN